MDPHKYPPVRFDAFIASLSIASLSTLASGTAAVAFDHAAVLFLSSEYESE